MNKNQEFEKLLAKKLTNELNEAEVNDFQLFMSDDFYSKKFEEMSKIWQSSGFAIENISFDKKSAYQTFLTNKPSKVRKLSFFKIASSIAALFILAIFAIFLINTSSKKESYFASENSEIRLDDGSRISLSKGSSIEWSGAFGTKNRDVSLNGEAFFAVAKNADLPFNIHTSSFDIRVLGTTFMVNTSSNINNVQVLEGKVKVKSDQNEALLHSREGLSIDKGVFTKIDNLNFSPTQWIKLNMEYNNTPITKVMSDLEMKHNIKFIKKSQQDINNCTFTSKNLESVDLKEVISLLELTFDTKFEFIEPNIYEFRNIKCN